MGAGARTIAVLGYDDAQVLDTTGPAEVFAAADAIAGGGLYDVAIVTPDGRDITAFSGVRLGARCALVDLPGPIDTLMIPGTPDWAEVSRREPLLEAVRVAAGRSRRVAAVCAGAFLVGRIGMLDGRRATTHWMLLDWLASEFPLAQVERGPIFVADGDLFTSAGITAGIDLALALVEADHGPELARDVARYLVVFLQRPGGQAQFSARMRAQPPGRSPLRALLDEVAGDPAGDHRLSAMSARARFSERHLTRLFARELGTTPARYVEQVRVEAARALLEASDAPLETIARQSGLGSAETLRRLFARELGVTPHAYRRRFRTTGVLAAAS